MHARASALLVLLLVLVSPLGAREGDRRRARELPPREDAPSANKVDGLELPPDQTADPEDRTLITVQARTEAKRVRWLVVCARPVDSVELEDRKALSVGLPHVRAGEGDLPIQVFCVGILKDDLTPFARTVITVKAPRGPPAPKPDPGPDPAPGPGPKPTPTPPAAGRLHVTAVLDYDAMTPAQAALVNSATLRKALAGGGDVFRVYPVTATELTTSKLTGYLSKGGGVPAVIVQDDKGKVLTRNAKGEPASVALPATEADLLALVDRIHRGG